MGCEGSGGLRSWQDRPCSKYNARYGRRNEEGNGGQLGQSPAWQHCAGCICAHALRKAAAFLIEGVRHGPSRPWGVVTPTITNPVELLGRVAIIHVQGLS
jgi:hypothetical protein